MKFRKSTALAAAAVTAASLGAAAVVGGSAAGASTPGVPTVTVHVGGGHIGVVGGNTLHAGRIQFRVITGAGDHILQILRLHHGYSLQQAAQDIGQAFGGNTDAIARVDHNISWRGGAETRPNAVGRFVVTLRPGHFYFLDQNSNAVKPFTVVGTVPHRPGVAHTGKVTAYSYGFGAPRTLPAKNTVQFFNQSDQPHFLEMQHVAAGTTRQQVVRGLQSHSRPSWVRAGSTSAGVISPYTGQLLSYDLPPGKYVIACFWPAIDTGMPHAFMGMFTFVTLK